jgi:DNA-binding XRE family transcriptional regulator
MDVTQKPGTHPNRVRELREDRLMTQAQLARKARVALRTIHSVEKGMNCRMDTKRKILLALGMRFEDKDQVFPSGRRASGYSAGLEALASLSAGPLPGSEDNLA